MRAQHAEQAESGTTVPRATIVTAGRRVREVIGLTGPYAAVDGKLTGRENWR